MWRLGYLALPGWTSADVASLEVPCFYHVWGIYSYFALESGRFMGWAQAHFFVGAGGTEL